MHTEGGPRVPRTLIFGGGGPPHHSPPPLLQNLKISGSPGGRVGAPRKIRGDFLWQKRPKNENFLWQFFGDFPKFRLRRRSNRGGLPPPTPPRLILTCWRAAGRGRRRSGKASAPARRRGGFRVLCNPASLILLPCHPPPIPTPPLLPLPPRRLVQPVVERQQRGGLWGSGARAGRGASPMPPPVPGFHCPPPSLPAPATVAQADGSPCCSQVMAVRGGRCAPAGGERRGGDRVDEALCDAERGLGPFLPTGVAFSGAKSAQNAQNYPLCPRTPDSTQCCYQCALRAAAAKRGPSGLGICGQ